MVLLFACDTDFEPGSRVHDVRLLALRADHAYARPGEQVELELLAANPRQRELAWAKATCTLPPSSTLEGCLSALDGPFEPFDAADPDALVVEVPDDALDGLSDDARPSALIGVVVVACRGTLADSETAGVPIACRDDEGRALPIGELPVGMKRIFVREHDRNQNPRITRVLFDGEPWAEDDVRAIEPCEHSGHEIDDCASALRHELRVETEPAEQGRDELGAEYREQIVVQFYASAGVYRHEVRIAGEADNAYALQSGRGGEPASLWIVARDNRGGVDWIERKVQAP